MAAFVYLFQPSIYSYRLDSSVFIFFGSLATLPGNIPPFFVRGNEAAKVGKGRIPGQKASGINTSPRALL